MPSVDKFERAAGQTSSRMSVIRGVIVSGFGSIVSRIIEMSTAVLLLHWLTIFEFGVYRLAIAAYDFGTSFFLVGAQNIVISEVTRNLTSDFKGARRIFSVYFFLWERFYFAMVSQRRLLYENNFFFILIISF